MASPLALLRQECAQFLAGMDKPFALRRAKDNAELLVASLPPLFDIPDTGISFLAQQGYACHWDQSRSLLFLSPTGERLDQLFDGYSKAPPPLPKEEAFHPVYALCRLLFLHPTPLREQPLAPVYRVLKLMDAAPDPLFLQAIPALHEDCALRLRQHSPLPSLMAPLLANWLVLQNIGFGGAPHGD